jgi:hypothetical protein
MACQRAPAAPARGIRRLGATRCSNVKHVVVGHTGTKLCHGAGGMAGHVRFGARTGGSLVMLGAIMMTLALFFSNSVGLLFQIFPKAVLGVILFFAGAELAITTKDIGSKKEDVYVMLVVAGFAMWDRDAADPRYGREVRRLPAGEGARFRPERLECHDQVARR